MHKTTLILIVLAALLPIAGWLMFQWWKLMHSEAGERYLKWRMQGPFVPLSKDDIARDDARNSR
jgi:hypothetical protein